MNYSSTSQHFASAAILSVLLTNSLVASERTFRAFVGTVTDVATNGTLLFPAAVRYPDGSYSESLNAFGLTFDQYGNGTVATEISDDGLTIAGHGISDSSQFYQGWVKYGDGPFQAIGTLGGDRSLVYGMSQDGIYLAGTSYNAQGHSQGFRWSQAAGMERIDFLPKSSNASVSGISENGRVVVGTASIIDERFDPGHMDVDCADECGPIVAQYYQAFVWTEESGTVSLGHLGEPPGSVDELGRPPKPYDTHATAISDDGTTVVGYGPPLESWIWRSQTGMRSIPGLPNQSGTFFPLDVSGDGSVVVGGIGGSCGNNCFSGPGAVVWDKRHGTRLLKTALLEEYGMGIPVLMEHATYISADGRTIAGRISRRIGGGKWIVTLPYSLAAPEPSAILHLLVAAAIFACRRPHRLGT